MAWTKQSGFSRFVDSAFRHWLCGWPGFSAQDRYSLAKQDLSFSSLTTLTPTVFATWFNLGLPLVFLSCLLFGIYLLLPLSRIIKDKPLPMELLEPSFTGDQFQLIFYSLTALVLLMLQYHLHAKRAARRLL